MSPQPNRFDTGAGGVVHFRPALHPDLSPQVRKGEAMKRIAMRFTWRSVLKRVVPCGLLAILLSSMTGCATPAYSANERNKMISRTWGYEARQAVDDWDEFWMLRPPSRMTIWHVR